MRSFSVSAPSAPRQLPFLVLAVPALVVLYAVPSAIYTGAPLFSLLVAGFLTVALALSCLRLLSSTNRRMVFTVLLGVRWLLLLYQARYMNLPLGGIDWYRFHSHAAGLLNRSSIIWDVLFDAGSSLFIKLVALIYGAFGVNAAQINFWVFFTSLVTFRYILLAARELGGSSPLAEVTALLFLAWPNEAVLSVTYLREMPIQALVAFSLYQFVVFIKRKSARALLAAILSAAAATMMHSGLLGILLVYLFVAATLSSKRGLSALNPVRVGAFVLVVGLLMTSPIASSLTTKFGDVGSAEDVVVETQSVLGNTAYISRTPANSIDLLLQTPWRVLLFVLSPLPWQVYSVGTAIAWLLDGVLRLWVMYRLIRYFRHAATDLPWKRATRSSLVMMLLVTYIIFAWGTSNYGTAMRHRAKVFPVEIIVVYAAYESSGLRRGRRRPGGEVA